jgi:hypothetical protein
MHTNVQFEQWSNKKLKNKFCCNNVRKDFPKDDDQWKLKKPMSFVENVIVIREYNCIVAKKRFKFRNAWQ